MPTIFTKRANALPLQILIFVGLVIGLIVAGITYYATPKYSRVGYAPVQPVPFDHSLHAGQLGLDCRYCHSFVEVSGHANVPTSQTCMACHNQIRSDSPLIAPVKHSYESGRPLPWVRVHQAPDFVYFNHAAHVNRGVSCYSCHGQVNEMPVVFHAESQSMAWCLDCHRAPEKHLRPVEQVFNLDWRPQSPEAQREQGLQFVKDWNVRPPLSCSGCHR
jgi:hypothetical protein